MVESFLNGKVSLYCGDSMEILATIEENSIDACVTDPPYHLTSIVKRFGNAKIDDGTQTSERIRTRADGYARSASGFMGKQWDGGDIAFRPELWALVYRALKPGAHLVAFGGTRTYHRMACAIEDAGFEIRDQIQWLYGSGFPKSHDVSKAIDKAAGAEREVIRTTKYRDIRNGHGRGLGDGINAAEREGPEYIEHAFTAPATEAARIWEGFGTALKPACEPIVLARKPLEGTVAQNVLKWGTGALNIDGCRVATDETITATRNVALGSSAGGIYGKANKPGVYSNRRAGEASAERRYTDEGSTNFAATPGPRGGSPAGRWPANIIHDGSEEVVTGFPYSKVGASCVKRTSGSDGNGNQGGTYGAENRPAGTEMTCYGDEGSAARFFYTAKADADDRLGSKHPTVKPLDLMQYLVRLVAPPSGLVLDPFAGTGTTAEAAWREGMRAVLIEREQEYQEDIRRRMALALSGPDERAREGIKAKMKDKPADHGPLFANIEYDAADDMRKSIELGFKVIRERVAAGGEPWIPKSTDD